MKLGLVTGCSVLGDYEYILVVKEISIIFK